VPAVIEVWRRLRAHFIHVAGLQQPAFAVSTTPTNKTIRPLLLYQGLKAAFFDWKVLL